MSSTSKRNFSSGEIAPALYARTDQEKYQNAVRVMRNFIALRHGGASNRPGTYLDAETKASGAVRLIDFVFSLDPANVYVLEFGALYLRLHQNGAPVVTTGVAAYAGGTAYVIGDLVVDVGVTYYSIQAGTGHTPAISPTYWYPLVGGVYEIPTPYTADELSALQVVQSADVLTITHTAHAPRELHRLGHTDWTLSAISFGPPIAAPTGLGVAGTISADAATWAVTAIDDATGEESLAATKTANFVPAAGTPSTITWAAVAGARGYNVYRKTGNTSYAGYRSTELFGFIGNASGLVFVDTGTLADQSAGPPRTSVDFSGSETPGVVGMYQQRRLLAASTAHPERVWGSRTGGYAEFLTSFPIQDDDAIEFGLAGKRVNAVRHLLDLDRLIVFTTAGAWVIEGDVSGILLPTAINPRQVAYNGAGLLAPIVVSTAALYVQARGSIVRDLRPDAPDDQRSRDLTIFAAHLFDGYTLVDWAYQETPHSIVWVVRSDGALLGLTYLREEEIWGWHRHDTDGAVERVCVVPEGAEDALYLVVRRTINGVTKRYIERMVSRDIPDTMDPRDLFFVDCGLTYDGRNAGATTMTIFGGGTWDEQEQLGVTASADTFGAWVVGDAVVCFDAAGAELFRLEVTAVWSPTLIDARPNKLVPVNARNVAIVTWARAVRTVTGLAHLEGKAVSIFADGAVAASPNNPEYAVLTVAAGAVTMDRARSVIHVGLPYTCDLELLDIDTAGGPSLKAAKMNVNKVAILTDKSLPAFVGGALPTGTDPLEDMDLLKVRDESDGYGAMALRTAQMDVITAGRWNTTGRIAIRQVDPAPFTALAVIPQGFVPALT